MLWNVVSIIIVLAVVAADQLSKLWIRNNLVYGQSIVEIGIFRITRIHNTGAAFGLFQGQSFGLTIVAAAGAVILLVYILFVRHRYPLLDNTLSKLALGLVLGGTIGNLIDRLNMGYVTDFIDIGFWPAFNVADSAITVGVFIFVYSLFPLVKKEIIASG
ncbi:signal peptidase II [Chloroflexota bacterium]